MYICGCKRTASYTHLTLPTNRGGVSSAVPVLLQKKKGVDAKVAGLLELLNR